MNLNNDNLSSVLIYLHIMIEETIEHMDDCDFQEFISIIAANRLLNLPPDTDLDISLEKFSEEEFADFMETSHRLTMLLNMTPCEYFTEEKLKAFVEEDEYYLTYIAEDGSNFLEPDNGTLLHYDFLEKKVISPKHSQENISLPEEPTPLPDIPFLSKEHNFTPQETKYLIDMWKNKDTKGKQVKYVTCDLFNPSYDRMNKSQLKRFFYIRERIHQGETPQCDNTYLQMIAIEYIHFLHHSTPEDVQSALISLYRNYAEELPYTCDRLLGWTFDFTIEHDLSFYNILALPYLELVNSARLDLLIESFGKSSPLKLTPNIINSISDFPITRSKLPYDKFGGELAQNVAYLITKLDEELLKNKKSFIKTYCSGQKRAFTLHYYPYVPGKHTHKEHKIKNFCNNKKFVHTITEIARFTENTLRSLEGIRGRLQKIDLDPELQEKLNTWLVEKHKNPTPQEGPAPVVSLNFQQIDLLRNQSDAVRDALEIPEEAPILKVQTPKKQEAKGKKSKKEKMSTDTNLPTDFQDFAQDLQPHHKKALEILCTNQSPLPQLQALAEDNFSMVESLVEEINNLALENIGDILLEIPEEAPIILEEYREPLELLLKSFPLT